MNKSYDFVTSQVSCRNCLFLQLPLPSTTINLTLIFYVNTATPELESEALVKAQWQWTQRGEPQSKQRLLATPARHA